MAIHPDLQQGLRLLFALSALGTECAGGTEPGMVPTLGDLTGWWEALESDK